MAVDKNSKAYQSLLKSGYTDEQINQMSSSVAGGQSAKDVVASTQPTNTTVTYGGKSNVTPTNVVSQQSQNANYNNAKVGTGAVAGMPEQPKITPSGVNIDNIAKAWNNMDYATQQDRLSKISGLKEALAKNGITIKQQPEQTTTQAAAQTTTKATTPTNTTTAKTTPQQDRWDYQDNSQARMNQMANNLNEYRQTNPLLFEDGSAFYNFFIKDKGRSQDQIDFLWDYFNRVQKFGKYDNLPASTIGDMLVNGKLGDDYLNYLKSTDPQKYQEALSYRQDGEDTIKYESYLSDIADQAGLSGFEKFYKGIFGYRDENDDKIDDSLYIAPTEEEQKDVDRINEINARRMEIKNMQKNLLDDLVEQYPGVPKATLMGIVQDRTKDISREYDDLGVELVQLQGSVEYMQNERDAQSKARQSTINNLKTAYGMYYDYTPEGMAEYAQAKYAATNVTLDQAEKGNDTQKQMALESVLDGYYAQYGDIIQRSEAQVINDVMAYAKKNGVSLSQALQENFVDQLKKKPEYKAMQEALSEPNLQIIGYNDDGKAVYGYWDSATKTFTPVSISGGATTTGGVGSAVTAGNGVSYTVMSSSDLAYGINNFLDKYKNGDDGGWCGAFVNKGLKEAGVTNTNMYGNSLESKLNSKNEENTATAQAGWVAIRNPDNLKSEDGKKYGHVGFVVKDNGDGTVVIRDSNGTPDKNGNYNKTVGTHTVRKSQLYGFFNPSKGAGATTVGGDTESYNKAFTDAANVIKQYIDGLGNKEIFMSDVEDYLANGDYTTLINEMMAVGKGNADSTVRDKINASETAIVDLISIKDALEAYYNAGGDTGILQGNLEKVANALGDTTDPRLVGLATKIAEAIQAYRKNISGTAFNDKERQEYEELFPSIKAGQEYNTAKVQEVLDSMIIRASGQYSSLFGPGIYKKLLDAHEQATGRKYSVYEEQSDLYRYLEENGYLTPSGKVKSSEDFASYRQSIQNKKQGKRF